MKKRELTGKQLRGIEAQIDALFAGKSITAICKSLGVSRQTWYEWQRSPEYRKAARERYNDLTFHYRARLLALFDKALTVLEKQITSKNLYAAVKAIEVYCKLQAQNDLDVLREEMEALKASLPENQPLQTLTN